MKETRGYYPAIESRIKQKFFCVSLKRHRRRKEFSQIQSPITPPPSGVIEQSTNDVAQWGIHLSYFFFLLRFPHIT